MKVQCDDCQRIVEAPNNDSWENATCKDCQGYFSEYDSSSSHTEDTNDDDNETTECEECGQDYSSKFEIVEFPESGYMLCKSCIRRYAHVEGQALVVEKEKIVFRDRPDRADSINMFPVKANEKSRFD